LKYSVSTSNYIKSLIFAVLYFFILTLIVLSGLSTNLYWVNYICKPLLMPSLAMFFVVSSNNYTKPFYGILLALFFSWLGDVFLLFENYNELFFISGLLAFLVAHLGYIYVFKLDVKNYDLIKSKPYIPFILLFYLAVFLFFLKPNLNELFFPVCIYASIICTMLLFAILRNGQVGEQSFQLSCFGALLFVLSDSFIAINKFLFPFEWAYALIIILYSVGQFFIIKGLLAETENE